MNSRCLFLSLLLSTNALLGACGGGSGRTASTPLSGDVAADPLNASIPAPGSPYVPAGSSDWPLFIFPQPGDPNVDVTHAIQWTAANDARAYQLQLGTTVEGNDIYDSGIITATSVPMPQLPAGMVIYARVRAILTGWGDDFPAGTWPRGSYTRFRTDDQTPASTFSNVAVNTPLPAGAPLQWNASPLALGYRLIIRGATFDSARTNSGIAVGNINIDSGLIHTTRVFINVPTKASVFATLQTIYLDRTATAQVIFTAAGGTPTFADYYASAKQLTGEVRSMADRTNEPYGATVLDQISNSSGLSIASCQQFKLALLQLLREARVGADVRELDIALQQNEYDTHTLLEILDPSSGRWSTLDPTFGLDTLRSDGVPATTVEISAAVRAQNWTALNFEFLTGNGDVYARDNYIDYPLLFMDIESPDGSEALVQAPPATLAPYFDSLPLPVSSAQTTAYALQCASGFGSATADVDSVAQTMPCNGSDQLTWIFWGNTIQATAGNNSTAAVWQVRRFVF
jgi:hypothetical protein